SDERGEYRLCPERFTEYDKSDNHEGDVHHQTERTRLYRRHEVMKNASETVHATGNDFVRVGEEHEPGRHNHRSDQHAHPREPDLLRAQIAHCSTEIHNFILILSYRCASPRAGRTGPADFPHGAPDLF